MEADFLRSLHEVRRMAVDMEGLMQALEGGTGSTTAAAKAVAQLLGAAAKKAYAPVSQRVAALAAQSKELTGTYDAANEVGVRLPLLCLQAVGPAAFPWLLSLRSHSNGNPCRVCRRWRSWWVGLRTWNAGWQPCSCSGPGQRAGRLLTWLPCTGGCRWSLLWPACGGWRGWGWEWGQGLQGM